MSDKDLVQVLHENILVGGGYFNAHAHLDRAYTVQDLTATYKSLHAKWKHVDTLKRGSSTEDYYARMVRALERQKSFGVTHCVTFVDVDPVSEDRALQAAKRARIHARHLGVDLKLACQTLKGVLDPAARKWFDLALADVDIIGGLPAADRGCAHEHVEVLLKACKETGKPVHIHVDQLDTPDEKETEMVADLVAKHGCEGKVAVVHAISIAAHPKAYRELVYQKALDAGLAFISCPTAWIDRRRREDLAPVHNSVTPIDELIPHGIPVFLGSDNIGDVYKPYSDGNMLVELRVLLESTHFYDMEKLVDIATWPEDQRRGYFG